MAEEKYVSFTTEELSLCKHIGHGYFCESIYLVKHKTSQIYESEVFCDLSQDISSDDCEFNFFYNMTPEAAILDAGDIHLLSKLDKHLYLCCDEFNNVPIPIPAYEYSVINRLLLCDCQLKRIE